MGRKSQTIEEWIKAEKARQDWLDQKLRDAGLRRLTHEGQDTIDALISDLEEALPKGADRAEAIRKLKQNWRVFKSSQKNKTINLAANVSRHTRESLKKLAKARGKRKKPRWRSSSKKGFKRRLTRKQPSKKPLIRRSLAISKSTPRLNGPPFPRCLPGRLRASGKLSQKKTRKFRNLERSSTLLVPHQ